MIVLSHRGYWLEPAERNLAIAFRRSFECGFGTETDVRDRGGDLVISHDIPNGEAMTLTDFLEVFQARRLPLAINIKADGLVAPLKASMQAANVRDWFVFDMAVADMRAYLAARVPVFTRMSEVEREPAWLDRCQGIWLDAFDDVWYGANDIEAMIRTGKRVCVVSPELHGRHFESLWQMLRPLRDQPALMLCTDYPQRAAAFFGASE